MPYSQSNIELFHESESLIEDLSIPETKISLAIRRAVNKSIKPLTTLMSRDVRQKVRIKMNFIRSRFKFFAADRKNMQAAISALAYDIPAIILNLTPSQMRALGLGANLGRSFTARNVNRRYRDRSMSLYRVGRDAYPLRENRVRIQGELESTFRYWSAQVEERFYRFLVRELRYIGGIFEGV